MGKSIFFSSYFLSSVLKNIIWSVVFASSFQIFLHGAFDVIGLKIHFEPEVKDQIADILDYEYFKQHGIDTLTNHPSGISDVAQARHLKEEGSFTLLSNYLIKYLNRSPLIDKISKWKIYSRYYLLPFEDFIEKKYTLPEIITFLRYPPPTFMENPIDKKQAEKIILWLQKVITHYARDNQLIVTLNPLLLSYQAIYGKKFLRKKFSVKKNLEALKNPERFLQQFAWLLYQKGYMEESLFIYELYYQTYPAHFKSNIYSAYTLAHVYKKLERPKQAIFHIKNFIDEANREADKHKRSLEQATLLLVQSYVLHRQTKSAYRLMTSSLTIYPTRQFYGYYLYLTQIYYPSRYDAVKQTYIKKFPDSYRSYVLNRRDGIALFERKKYAQALEKFKQAYLARGRRSYFNFIDFYLTDKDELTNFFRTKREPYFDYILTNYLAPSDALWRTNYQKLVEADKKLWDETVSISISNNQNDKKNQKNQDDNTVRTIRAARLEKIRFPFAYEIEPLKKDYWLLHKKDDFMKKFYMRDNLFAGRLSLNRNNFRMHALLSFSHFDLAKAEINKLAGDDAYLRYLYEKKFVTYSRDSASYIKKDILQTSKYHNHFNILPRDFLRDAYPRPLYFLVKYFCELYGVPVAFIYAIMREESHFQRRALSSSGARGLMQIMPATGKYLYEKSGLIKAHPQQTLDLYDEIINLHLGIYYLGLLFKEWNSLVKTAASYNAGRTSVAKWIKSGRKDVIRFLISMPYTETDEYINRVFNSYAVYQAIYSD